jgi:hypothetical protein
MTRTCEKCVGEELVMTIVRTLFKWNARVSFELILLFILRVSIENLHNKDVLSAAMYNNNNGNGV